MFRVPLHGFKDSKALRIVLGRAWPNDFKSLLQLERSSNATPIILAGVKHQAFRLLLSILYPT